MPSNTPRPGGKRASPKGRRIARPTVRPRPAHEPRAARQQRKHDRSRGEIIEAARRVIVRDGLPALTLAAVAREVGLTKAALYYYFTSKDALLLDLMHASVEHQARTLHDAVEQQTSGPAALRAIIRATVQLYGPRLDDFRLNYLQPQIAGPNAVHVKPEHLARIRPLNDVAYAGAAQRLTADLGTRRSRAGVEPRLMVFLANLAALGVLTMKGLVETFDDPLLYSDDQLIDALARIFEAAAAPAD